MSFSCSRAEQVMFPTRFNLFVQIMNNEAGPTSPWMSFTGLFAEIQDEICPIARELLALHYDELKVTFGRMNLKFYTTLVLLLFV